MLMRSLRIRNNVVCHCRWSSTSGSSGYKDYYEILDITPDATPTEIREAFYRKAKQCHPDVNPSEEAKAEFMKVKEAFKALKTPATRIDYDRHLFTGSTKGAGVPERGLSPEEAARYCL